MSESAVVEIGQVSWYTADTSPPTGLGNMREREQGEYRPPPTRVDPIPAPLAFDSPAAPLPSLAEIRAERASMEVDRDRRRKREYLEIVRRIASGERLPGDVVLTVCEAAGKGDADYQADIASYRERERLLAVISTEAAERAHAVDLRRDRETADADVAKLRPAYLAAKRAIDAAESKRRIAQEAMEWQSAKLAKISSAKQELSRPEYAQFSSPESLDRIEAANEARLRSFHAAQASENCRLRRAQAHGYAVALRNQLADLQLKQRVARESLRQSQAALIGEQIKQLQESITAADDALAIADKDLADARQRSTEAEREAKAASAAVTSGGAQ